jgi:hypothetical protein
MLYTTHLVAQLIGEEPWSVLRQKPCLLPLNYPLFYAGNATPSTAICGSGTPGGSLEVIHKLALEKVF